MKSLDHYWYSINFISLLLLPLSGFFCLISKIRRLLFKVGVLKSYKAPVPVIIVGNISVGGTGKTPLIIELIKKFQSQGKTAGVISRGYGGKSSVWPRLVNEQSTAKEVGDEPKLIHELTQCPIAVGPDRQKDIELLIQHHNCDVILSDDGMQHYALGRDVEIAVVDSKRKFGNGFCLPSGPLRERVSRLQEVDLVLLNGGGEDQLSFKLQSQVCKPVNILKIESIPLADLKNKTVHAVAGIGNPSRFFSMLNDLGINVIEHEFPDHYQYQSDDLLFSDDLPVLMTEKDAVKCKGFELNNHWSVPVEVKFSKLAEEQLQQVFNLV